MNATRFALFSLAVVLAGCARFQPKPLSPAQQAADFEQRTLHDPGLKAFLETNDIVSAWPRATWGLDALTLAAFYYHPDLDIVRAQWMTARAGSITAGERPNPSLGVAPGYNSTQDVPTPWFVTLNLDIPIETAGKRGYRLARAQHLTEAARLNIASVAWQVRGRLRRAFVDVYAARQTESLLRQQMGTLEQVSRFLEAQHSAGEVSPFEVTQARIALDRNRLALHDAERRRGEAQAQLASAIGIPASRLDEAVVSFAGLAEMPVDLPPEQARRDALLNRADILSALAAYAATESALQLEVAKQYPDVRFSPGYEYDQGENKWSLGLSITLPVLNQNQGAIAEAEGRRTQAAVQFNALQARVLGEIDLAAASYRALRSKAATANSLLANLEQQQRNLLSRLEAGEISRLEVSTFQLELSQAALARLETVAQTQQALGALEEAVQSPMEVIDGLWRRSPRAVAIQEKDKHE